MTVASTSTRLGTQARAKQLARRVITSSLPYSILRGVLTRKPHVAILMYHTLGRDDDDFDAWTVVRVSDFKQQVAFVRRYYDIVSLDEALTADANERPMAVVTFDDGDIGLHEHLLPLVDELELPATIYVSTGQVETGERHWFDKVMNALQPTTPLQIDLTSLGLETWTIGAERGEANWFVIASLLDRLKTVTPAVRDAACKVILAQAERLDCRSRSAPLGPMSIEQLRRLARHPLVTIGSHTHCHSLLDRIPLGEATASIARSCRLLEQWTGARPAHFAYPNGNHSPALERAVASLGFRSATTAGGGRWFGGGNLMALQRLPVGRFDDLGRFALRLAGL